jgi:hypothetical protein
VHERTGVSRGPAAEVRLVAPPRPAAGSLTGVRVPIGPHVTEREFSERADSGRPDGHLSYNGQHLLDLVLCRTANREM